VTAALLFDLDETLALEEGSWRRRSRRRRWPWRESTPAALAELPEVLQAA
jgi:hypothetical protein